MVFWGCILLVVISFILTMFLDDWSEIFSLFTAIASVAFLSMIPFVIAANTGLDAKLAREYEEYYSLVYQYENDIYDNDNDLGKRELMEDIQTWNSDLAYKQRIQDNFWVGIFYPDIYHHIEFIELKGGEKKHALQKKTGNDRSVSTWNLRTISSVV